MVVWDHAADAALLVGVFRHRPGDFIRLRNWTHIREILVANDQLDLAAKDNRGLKKRYNRVVRGRIPFKSKNMREDAAMLLAAVIDAAWINGQNIKLKGAAVHALFVGSGDSNLMTASKKGLATRYKRLITQNAFLGGSWGEPEAENPQSADVPVERPEKEQRVATTRRQKVPPRPSWNST